MDLKMIVYSIQIQLRYLEGENVYISMRYSSMDEAKKHMVALYDKKLSDSKCEFISFDNAKYILRYRDKLFKYDNIYICEIIEEEIEIKDKFDPRMLF